MDPPGRMERTTLCFGTARETSSMILSSSLSDERMVVENDGNQNENGEVGGDAAANPTAAIVNPVTNHDNEVKDDEQEENRWWEITSTTDHESANKNTSRARVSSSSSHSAWWHSIPKGAEAIVKGIAARKVLVDLLDNRLAAPKHGSTLSQALPHVNTNNNSTTSSSSSSSSSLSSANVDFEAVHRLVVAHPEICHSTYEFQWDHGDVRHLTPLAMLSCFPTTPVALLQTVAEIYPPALHQVEPRKGCLPFHYACTFDASLSVVEYLYQQYPAAIQTLRNDGMYPLHLAIYFQARLPLIQQLVQYWPDALWKCDYEQWNALHAAARGQASIAVVRYLDEALRKYHSPQYHPVTHPMNTTTSNNNSNNNNSNNNNDNHNDNDNSNQEQPQPLPAAPMDQPPNDAEPMDETVTLGDDNNGGDPGGSVTTAAATTTVVPEDYCGAVDGKGRTPLHLACRKPGNLKVIQYFVQHAPHTLWMDDNTTPHHSSVTTPLFLAARFQTVPVMQYLLQQVSQAVMTAQRQELLEQQQQQQQQQQDEEDLDVLLALAAADAQPPERHPQGPAAAVAAAIREQQPPRPRRRRGHWNHLRRIGGPHPMFWMDGWGATLLHFAALENNTHNAELPVEDNDEHDDDDNDNGNGNDPFEESGTEEEDEDEQQQQKQPAISLTTTNQPGKKRQKNNNDTTEQEEETAAATTTTTTTKKKKKKMLMVEYLANRYPEWVTSRTHGDGCRYLPLQLACRYGGPPENIEYLVQKYPLSVLAKCQRGYTALDLAQLFYLTNANPTTGNRRAAAVDPTANQKKNQSREFVLQLLTNTMQALGQPTTTLSSTTTDPSSLSSR